MSAENKHERKGGSDDNARPIEPAYQKEFTGTIRLEDLPKDERDAVRGSAARFRF